MTFRSRRQLHAVADGLRPELEHPAGEKARARMVTRGSSLILSFEADNSAALRAILSSYLRLLSASLNVCNSLKELEQSVELMKPEKS
jgi:tRNA threonylcarbamoyladenosine modification (KEOPS) complex  Pcc1 subunit